MTSDEERSLHPLPTGVPMTAAMYDRETTGDRAPGALELLDVQLDRLDGSLERLTKLVQPVLRSEPEDDRVQAIDVSVTQLHERVARLSAYLNRLDRVMNKIEL